jgi:TRAP-type mannitol/chloroaromatic compound transport system permease small subunit
VPTQERAATPTVDLESLTLHLPLPETAISRRLDAWIRRIGDIASWIWIGLVGVVVSNVVLRYAFGEGRIEFEELQWHLYATGFLVALSYAVQSDDHVRVDFLHARFSARLQAWVELYGITLLLFPFTALVLVHSAPFIAHSFSLGEVSAAPGGLPFRWLMKSTLFAGFALLGLAALSRLLRVAAFLFGERPTSSEAARAGGRAGGPAEKPPERSER